MCLIAAAWLTTLTVGVFEPEYDGPAHASYSQQARPLPVLVRASAMVCCVEAGMGPEWLDHVFGSPLITSRTNKGPTEWWYPELGVTVYYPVKALRSGDSYERLEGTIGPE